MCFEKLYESYNRSELLLINGGMCNYHLRKDGQLTIREIFSTRPGAGTEILEILKNKHPKSIYAKCPIDLDSNIFYQKKNFILENTEITPSGRIINCWRLTL